MVDTAAVDNHIVCLLLLFFAFIKDKIAEKFSVDKGKRSINTKDESSLDSGSIRITLNVFKGVCIRKHTQLSNGRTADFVDHHQHGYPNAEQNSILDTDHQRTDKRKYGNAALAFAGFNQKFDFFKINQTKNRNDNNGCQNRYRQVVKNRGQKQKGQNNDNGCYPVCCGCFHT